MDQPTEKVERAPAQELKAKEETKQSPPEWTGSEMGKVAALADVFAETYEQIGRRFDPPRTVTLCSRDFVREMIGPTHSPGMRAAALHLGRERWGR